MVLKKQLIVFFIIWGNPLCTGFAAGQSSLASTFITGMIHGIPVKDGSFLSAAAGWAGNLAFGKVMRVTGSQLGKFGTYLTTTRLGTAVGGLSGAIMPSSLVSGITCVAGSAVDQLLPTPSKAALQIGTDLLPHAIPRGLYAAGLAILGALGASSWAILTKKTPPHALLPALKAYGISSSMVLLQSYGLAPYMRMGQQRATRQKQNAALLPYKDKKNRPDDSQSSFDVTTFMTNMLVSGILHKALKHLVETSQVIIQS